MVDVSRAFQCRAQCENIGHPQELLVTSKFKDVGAPRQGLHRLEEGDRGAANAHQVFRSSMKEPRLNRRSMLECVEEGVQKVR